MGAGGGALRKDEDGKLLFLLGLAHDITESKRAEEMIKASLHEKETLLKEIHHRVKNNLQITSSLLKLQSSRIKDEASKRAFRESQSRIRAIALVHEMLYRSRDLSHIDFPEYVQRLVRQVGRTYGSNSASVVIETQIDAGRAKIDCAVPCGLIISELVSNAYKHAFPGGRSGRIRVRFHATTDQRSQIEVSDSGIGLGPGFDPKTSPSLGLQLVRALATQIHATLTIASSEQGSTFCLTLPSEVIQLQTSEEPDSPVAR